MPTIPQRYIPKNLKPKDKKKLRKELKKSRRKYKKGSYYTRKKIKSFKSRPSRHILNAQKLYNIKNMKSIRNLERVTKCSRRGLKKIFKKGLGAYYSSGSRPNQTAHSWAYARLASSITGGKSSAVDFNIIKNECRKNSKAYKLAKRSLKKYKKGRRKVKKIQIGGRRKHAHQLLKSLF